MHMFWLFGVILVLLCHLSLTHAKMVAVKIVEEPTSYAFGGNFQNQDSTPVLHMRVPAANFSGPPHLRLLLGHCFSSVIESYKYEFCPFSNITQHEQSLRWNPYSGILGVWQEWEIRNNTFISMVMAEGDSCGSKHRTTKILLECGSNDKVLNVTEPTTCNYELIFSTPLVCHPQSLLVYPTLPRPLQIEWDMIEGRLLAGEITEKGRAKLLQRLFETAGYRIPMETKEKLSEEAKKAESQKPAQQASFNTLYQCQSEYNKLQEEVVNLRTVIRVNGIRENDDGKHGERGNHDEHGERGNHDDIFQDYNQHDYEWMHGKGDY